MTRPKNGTALFYHRDSGGKALETPAEYVKWARDLAESLKLSFAGMPKDIDRMIQDRRSEFGSLYLDFDVQGHIRTRPGLDALIHRCKSDKSISHIFCPRRDRLFRPNHPIDGVLLELEFQRLGVGLRFLDKSVEPLPVGKRQDIGEMIAALVDYDQAGKDRRTLADKVIYAHLALIKKGFSTGGRPPYGFQRWLVTEEGQKVRFLQDGERVRMRGHHVVWVPLPDDHPHMVTIRRILNELPQIPAYRLAANLTREGVPPPDFGRSRRDHGISHLTSGVWHSNTVTNVGRNALLAATCSYGRRSMGDQKRFDPSGPRELIEGDYRADEKPKVIRNPNAIETQTKAFEPIIAPDKHADLLVILNRRAGTQRGKPRSQKPGLNPLGSRIFDLNCGWTMYRAGALRYSCGKYMQKHGCSHNVVDGGTAVRYALHVLKDRLLKLDLRSCLQSRVVGLASDAAPAVATVVGDKTLRAELKRIQADIETAEGNLALSKSANAFAAVSKVLDRLKLQESEFQKQLREIEATPVVSFDAEAEIEAAMYAFDCLEDAARDADDLTAVGKAFDTINLRMFFKFEKRQVKKRVLNKVAGGVVTFGNEPPPVQLYSGPTSRKALKEELAALSAANPVGDGPRPGVLVSGEEGNSLGNVSRGDRI